jgi:hypothetical protein
MILADSRRAFGYSPKVRYPVTRAPAVRVRLGKSVFGPDAPAALKTANDSSNWFRQLPSPNALARSGNERAVRIFFERIPPLTNISPFQNRIASLDFAI